MPDIDLADCPFDDPPPVLPDEPNELNFPDHDPYGFWSDRT